jgi:hypothetical protein
VEVAVSTENQEILVKDSQELLGNGNFHIRRQIRSLVPSE